MSKSVLSDKSYELAIRVIKTYKGLCSQHREYVIGKQLLRSGTAIGAMISESEYAQSRSDFIHKLYIAQKEANETKYWVKLLRDTGYLSDSASADLSYRCTEIIRILASSIKTAKANLCKR